MRLIDADKLRKKIHCEYSDDLGILEKIDEQPTSYDIDGVVEQLKRCYGIVRSTSVDYAEGLKDAYERALKNYTAAVTGLTTITKDQVSANIDRDTFFIWEDNNFRYLEKDEIINEYLNRNITFYHPISPNELASQSTIDLLYTILLDYEKKFLDAVQSLIDAQEHGVI